MMAYGRRRRRRRRPVVLFVATLVSLLVLAVNAAAQSGPRTVERRLEMVAYLDEVRPQIERSTRNGDDLAVLRDRAAEMGRATVSRRLRLLATDAAGALRVVERALPPLDLRTSHSLVVATLAIRLRAAEALRAAIRDALDPSVVEPPIARIVNAYEDMAAADHTYAAFRESLPRRSDTRMPESRWLSAPPWSAEEAGAFVAAIRASGSLAPVRDIAVIVMTMDPTPVGTEGDVQVLPTVKTLKLHVVVANVGNDEVRRVPVVASVTAPTGQTDTARQFVDLAPGERRTVTVGGLQLTPGGQSSLSVRAGPVEGEGNLTDNERQKTLLLR